MDNTLWDTFAIEMCQQIDQMKILKKEWTIGTNSLKLLWVSHGASIGRSIDWSFIVLEGRGGLIVGNHDCYCIDVVTPVGSMCMCGGSGMVWCSDGWRMEMIIRWMAKWAKGFEVFDQVEESKV